MYHAIIKLFLGESDAEAPPRILWMSWCLLALAWIYPATFCLPEDALAVLQEFINRPWPLTLGFRDPSVANHVLFSALAKILIKGTGHHGLEFFYRLPDLAAGFLLLPLSFRVFSAAGGRTAGLLGSVLLAALPAFSFYALFARGYIVWLFLIFWCYGLLLAARPAWRRLVPAYFLLGLSHPLGLVSLAGFGLWGFWAAGKKPGFSLWLKNGLLGLPVLLCNIPIIRSTLEFERTRVRLPGGTFAGAMHFIPEWWEEMWGGLPGLSLVWLVFFLWGLWACTRKNWRQGLALAVFCGMIPLFFLVKKQPDHFFRYAVGTVPFWILAASQGLASLQKMKWLPAAAAGLLLLPWLPRLAGNFIYPQTAYRDVMEIFTADFPGQNTLYGADSCYATGAAFYARQYHLRYSYLADTQALADSLLGGNKHRAVFVPLAAELPPGLAGWVHARLRLYRRVQCVDHTSELYISP